MLEKLLKDWKGEIEINDKPVDVCKIDFSTLSPDTHILLHTSNKSRTQGVVTDVPDKLQYRITVKKYMTQHTSPGFDFMSKWNNDNPMPMRTMIGTVEKETRGMVYMKLHGQGLPVKTCMRCGRPLTNPVSMVYGIGPECMEKLGLVREIDEVEAIKLALTDIKWEGWIIKSAVLQKELI